MEHLSRPEHLRTLYALLLELTSNLEEVAKEIHQLDPDNQAPLEGLATKLEELTKEIARLEAAGPE
jgi:phage I-like protein